jgi:hypothetical protein
MYPEPVSEPVHDHVIMTYPGPVGETDHGHVTIMYPAPVGKPDHDHVIVLCPAPVESAVSGQPLEKVLALERVLRTARLGIAVRCPLVRRSGRPHPRLRLLHFHLGDLLLHALPNRIEVTIRERPRRLRGQLEHRKGEGCGSFPRVCSPQNVIPLYCLIIFCYVMLTSKSSSRSA